MTNRYRFGHDRDVILAMAASVPRTLAGKHTLADRLMFLTKLGDGAAIVVGGYAVYDYHYKKARKNAASHETAHKMALEQFSILSDRTQQAGDVKDLGYFQRMGSGWKLFTMFSTSPISYHRSVSGAVRNAMHGRGSKTEAMKRIVIGHFLLPMIFQWVANGFRWDDEDQLRAALLGSWNRLFILGDVLDATISALVADDVRAAVGVLQMPVGDVVADGVYALARLDRELSRGTLDDADVVFIADKIATVGGKVSGFPYEGVRNSVGGVKAAIEGTTDFPVRRALGFSEYAFDPADDDKAARRKAPQKRKVPPKRRTPSR